MEELKQELLALIANLVERVSNLEDTIKRTETYVPELATD